MAVPFVAWPGGKSRLLKEIIPRFPNAYSAYWEPFVGGGSVYFKEKPGVPAYISDLDEELMDCYRAVRESPEEVVRELEFIKYQRDTHTERFFRQVAGEYKPKCIFKRTARYIYISKHCFRGLTVRGSKSQSSGSSYWGLTFFNKKNIFDCSKILNRSTTISSRGYSDCCPAKGDFVYLDPPYYDVTSYYKNAFTEQDHIDLSNWCDRISKAGVKFMLSSSWNEKTLQWYRGFTCTRVNLNYAMKAGLQTGISSSELLVRNYDN